jgi:hypothetical protein
MPGSLQCDGWRLPVKAPVRITVDITALVAAVLVLALYFAVEAEASSETIRRFEAFRAPGGAEFLFVGGDEIAFCVSDSTLITVVVQPPSKPEAFAFDESGVFLLHARTVAAPRRVLDISELCD